MDNAIIEASEMTNRAEADHRHTEDLHRVLNKIGEFGDSKESMGENVDDLLDLDQLGESRYLSDRQVDIFQAWMKGGVRFDTAHWMRSLSVHFDVKIISKQPRYLVAALFVDIFNRADDVMDEFRDEFSTEDSDNVSISSLRSVPIMEMNGENIAVGEFEDILLKIISSSNAFGHKEGVDLSKEYGDFLSEAGNAIEEHERSSRKDIIEYGVVEAEELRVRTLYPLVMHASRLFESSSCVHGGTEKSGRSIESEMIALALTAQVLDDRNDWIEDYYNGNTNMILGIISDVCEEIDVELDEEMIREIEYYIDYDSGDSFEWDDSDEKLTLLGSIISKVDEKYILYMRNITMV